MNLIKYASTIGCAMMESMTKRNTMETSVSDRDAMIDLLYDMYDDVALEILGENELFDGIPAILEDYYYYFDENEDW
jgi:hypothetical protein